MERNTKRGKALKKSKDFDYGDIVDIEDLEDADDIGDLDDIEDLEDLDDIDDLEEPEYADNKKIMYGMAAVGTAGVIALVIALAALLGNNGNSQETMLMQPETIEDGELLGEGFSNEDLQTENLQTENLQNKEFNPSTEDASEQPSESDAQTEVSMGALDDEQDPQAPQGSDNVGSEDNGAEVTIAAIGENEVAGITIGIDVSKYQGTIDWSRVRAAGVEFAMIRVGYRAKATGEIFEDPTARYNMQEAQAAGVKIGAYFFSTAVTEEEARAEAAFTKDIISKYRITYPVAYNCEGYQSADSRQYGLDSSSRTNLACAFLDEISAAGYTPMFYASKGELEGNAQWNTDTLASKYKIWVAQYPDQPYPQTTASSYMGTHAMWQYTGQGIVDGISKKTDVNIAYFGYSQEAEAKDITPPEIVEANPEAGIIFTEVNEIVTAKQETNLRSEPSTLNDASIVTKLIHGDTATRTGIGHNGWSRVIYNGQTLYAVTSYLTTDMGDTGQQAPPQGPIYTPVSETVTAKIETNLRLEPSTANADTIVGVLHNGETLTRTAIGDNGWSQLDYNGITVYAVSSYLIVQ